MEKFGEVCIVPASSGFGEFDVLPFNGEAWDSVGDLVAALAENSAEQGGEIFELGVHALPEGVDDIRGAIHNEPCRVFAIVGGYTPIQYVGIKILKGEWNV